MGAPLFAARQTQGQVCVAQGPQLLQLLTGNATLKRVGPVPSGSLLSLEESLELNYPLVNRWVDGWMDGLSDEGKASLEEKVSLGHSSEEI